MWTASLFFGIVAALAVLGCLLLAVIVNQEHKPAMAMFFILAFLFTLIIKIFILH